MIWVIAKWVFLPVLIVVWLAGTAYFFVYEKAARWMITRASTDPFGVPRRWARPTIH